MTARPILFSGPMVRAILAGHKTQTRRVVGLHELRPSTTPGYDWTWRGQAPVRSVAQQRRHPGGCWQDVSTADLLRLCPYGVPGDELWVRETWRVADAAESDIGYRATDSTVRFLTEAEADAEWWKRWGAKAHGKHGPVWTPAIYMPRWASRLTLRVTEVRVERVQSIGPRDACNEGVFGDGRYASEPGIPYPVATFRQLWDSINAKRGFSWDANPWTWAVSFEVAA